MRFSLRSAMIALVLLSSAAAGAVLLYRGCDRATGNADEAVSDETPAPGGTFSACVWRQERAPIEPGEDPVRIAFLLRIRAGAGLVHEQWFDSGSYDDLVATRALRFRVAWTLPDQALTLTSSTGRTFPAFVNALGVIVQTHPVRLIEEPGTVLSPEIRGRLEALGRTPQELNSLREVRIGETYCGAGSRDILCEQRGVVLVFETTFRTHGSVASRGPMLFLGRSYPMNAVLGSSWIFMDNEFPTDWWREVRAAELYATERRRDRSPQDGIRRIR